MTCQIPVRVVNDIHDRGSVGCGRHLQTQFACRSERVGDHRSELPRIALVAGRRHQLQLESRPLIQEERRGFPKLLVESRRASVQVVVAVVLCQRVLFSIQFKGAASNPIGNAATRRATVRVFGHIAVECVKPQNNIDRLFVGRAGRHAKARQGCTVVDDRCLPSAGHRERIEADRSSVRQLSKCRHRWLGSLCSCRLDRRHVRHGACRKNTHRYSS